MLGEQLLFEALINQALEDLFSKARRKKQRAASWIHGTHIVRPIITFEECCDLAGKNKDDIRRIATGIIEGKLNKSIFKDIIKED